MLDSSLEVLLVLVVVSGSIVAQDMDDSGSDRNRIERFLLEAEIVHAEPIGKGVTNPWRLRLSDGSMTHDASFQSVDERANKKTLPSGEVELHFVDSYRYNIAAYRLAQLIGLQNMVPVTVERKWNGKTGSVTWWLDVLMDEAEMREKDIEPPDRGDWERQVYKVRVFDALVYDTDRNQSNNLVSKDWKLWMIDFTRAFRRWDKLQNPETMLRCDRALFERLQTLERAELESAMSDWLLQVEIDAVLKRRDRIVAHFQELIEARGLDQTLY